MAGERNIRSAELPPGVDPEQAVQALINNALQQQLYYPGVVAGGPAAWDRFARQSGANQFIDGLEDLPVGDPNQVWVGRHPQEPGIVYAQSPDITGKDFRYVLPGDRQTRTLAQLQPDLDGTHLISDMSGGAITPVFAAPLASELVHGSNNSKELIDALLQMALEELRQGKGKNRFILPLARLQQLGHFVENAAQANRDLLRHLRELRHQEERMMFEIWPQLGSLIRSARKARQDFYEALERGNLTDTHDETWTKRAGGQSSSVERSRSRSGTEENPVNSRSITQEQSSHFENQDYEKHISTLSSGARFTANARLKVVRVTPPVIQAEAQGFAGEMGLMQQIAAALRQDASMMHELRQGSGPNGSFLVARGTDPMGSTAFRFAGPGIFMVDADGSQSFG